MKMKPCPFCGNKIPRTCVSVGTKGKPLGYMVTCEPEDKPCGAQGPIKNSPKSAASGWNKRKSNFSPEKSK